MLWRLKNPPGWGFRAVDQSSDGEATLVSDGKQLRAFGSVRSGTNVRQATLFRAIRRHFRATEGLSSSTMMDAGRFRGAAVSVASTCARLTQKPVRSALI